MKIPPGPLAPATADMLTRKLTLLESLLNLRTESPLTFSINNGTPVLGINAQKRAIIKLTGNDSYTGGSGTSNHTGCLYSWVEQDIVPSSCSTTDMPGGMRGYVDKMPAIDLNGQTDLEEDLIVEAFLAPSGDHWRFSSPGGGIGGGGGGGSCCIGAPTGIYAISGEVCCNSTTGFSSSTFYFVWDPQDCVPYIFTTREDAVQFANEYQPPLDTTFYGECPVAE